MAGEIESRDVQNRINLSFEQRKNIRPDIDRTDVVFDEDMEYEFVTPSGKCEWGNFSAGERMKTMVATSFAFRDFMSARNGLNSNILVLDEYFDSAIDDLTVESVLGLLKDMSTELKQSIYVITHRKEVSADMFNWILVVEKKNGASRASFT